MKKSTNARRFDVRSETGQRIALRADAPLDEQFTKLELLWDCTRQRVVEIAVMDAIHRYYDPALDYAISILRLNDDGATVNADEVKAAVQTDCTTSAEGAAMIVAHAARRLRHQGEQDSYRNTYDAMLATVQADSE